MIELFVLMAIFGALWLVGSLIGLFFRLVFGLAFGLFGVLFAVGLGLILLPLAALALLPFLLPMLLLVGLVWLIVRASRRPTPAPTTH